MLEIVLGDSARVHLVTRIFHRQTRKLLGVHCIGEHATEIVHIGQAVMAHNGTIDYFRDTVFNYPTMAECYKVAAFDGLNKLCFDRLVEANRASIASELDPIKIDEPAVTATVLA